MAEFSELTSLAEAEIVEAVTNNYPRNIKAIVEDKAFSSRFGMDLTHASKTTRHKMDKVVRLSINEFHNECLEELLKLPVVHVVVLEQVSTFNEYTDLKTSPKVTNFGDSKFIKLAENRHNNDAKDLLYSLYIDLTRKPVENKSDFFVVPTEDEIKKYADKQVKASGSWLNSITKNGPSSGYSRA